MLDGGVVGWRARGGGTTRSAAAAAASARLTSRLPAPGIPASIRGDLIGVLVSALSRQRPSFHPARRTPPPLPCPRSPTPSPSPLPSPPPPLQSSAITVTAATPITATISGALLQTRLPRTPLRTHASSGSTALAERLNDDQRRQECRGEQLDHAWTRPPTAVGRRAPADRRASAPLSRGRAPRSRPRSRYRRNLAVAGRPPSPQESAGPPGQGSQRGRDHRASRRRAMRRRPRASSNSNTMKKAGKARRGRARRIPESRSDDDPDDGAQHPAAYCWMLTPTMSPGSKVFTAARPPRRVDQRHRETARLSARRSRRERGEPHRRVARVEQTPAAIAAAVLPAASKDVKHTELRRSGEHEDRHDDRRDEPDQRTRQHPEREPDREHRRPKGHPTTDTRTALLARGGERVIADTSARLWTTRKSVRPARATTRLGTGISHPSRSPSCRSLAGQGTAARSGATRASRQPRRLPGARRGSPAQGQRLDVQLPDSPCRAAPRPSVPRRRRGRSGTATELRPAAGAGHTGRGRGPIPPAPPLAVRGDGQMLPQLAPDDVHVDRRLRREALGPVVSRRRRACRPTTELTTIANAGPRSALLPGTYGQAMAPAPAGRRERSVVVAAGGAFAGRGARDRAQVGVTAGVGGASPCPALRLHRPNCRSSRWPRTPAPAVAVVESSSRRWRTRRQRGTIESPRAIPQRLSAAVPGT